MGRFRVNPHTISGNGNLALVVIIPLLPLLITFYLLIGIISHKIFTRLKTTILLLYLSVCAVILWIGTALEIEYVQELLKQLGGRPEVPESRIYRFPWLNQYTNTIYFNAFTFSLSLVLSSLVGALLAAFSKERSG